MVIRRPELSKRGMPRTEVPYIAEPLFFYKFAGINVLQMNYIEAEFVINPYSEDISDWIVAEAGDAGFESFISEPPALKAYINKDAYSKEEMDRIAGMFSSLDGISVTCKVSDVENRNWNEIWESNFEPIIVGDLFSVRAPFHKNVRKTKHDIVIEPKMAFGTGHHQTTMMMAMSLLQDVDPAGKSVLDMGCGTGILSILAFKMGASSVDAIDIDEIAADSAKENASVNGAGLNVFCGDASMIGKDRYDIVLANINRNVLLADMGRYYDGLKASGKLVISGFYVKDREMLLEEASEKGFKYVSARNEGEWSSMIFSK